MVSVIAKPYVSAIILLYIGAGCYSLPEIHLPYEITVIDGATKKPIHNASMKIVWRVGVGGVTWGKSIELLSDSNGVVDISEKSVPAISETGYSLKKPLRKIKVDRIFVNSAGYRPYAVWEYKQVPSIIEMQRE